MTTRIVFWTFCYTWHYALSLCLHELPTPVFHLTVSGCDSSSLAQGHGGELTFLPRITGLGRSSQTAWVIIEMCSSHLCSLLSSFHHFAGSDFRFPLLALPSVLSRCVTVTLRRPAHSRAHSTHPPIPKTTRYNSTCRISSAHSN